MKAIILSILIISAQTSMLKISEYNIVTTLEIDTPVVGRYEECIALLTKILLEADELANAIINKEYQKVVPLAIKLAKDIYDDINCFKNGISFDSLIKLFEDPTECIIKHIKAAAEHLRKAFHAIKEKNVQEFVKELKAAIAEIQAAQQCVKETPNPKPHTPNPNPLKCVSFKRFKHS